jgi:hypothetical protein
VYNPNTGLGGAGTAKRPGLLRHATDEGPGRGGSPAPTLRDGREQKDRRVKANLMSSKKGGGRLGAMAKGPGGMYAVGGTMGGSCPSYLHRLGDH